MRPVSTRRVPECCFVLDNDTSVAVSRILRKAGRQCVAAAASGLASASDDHVSVFADEHHAVLLTHDVEFTARRRRNTFGKHVLLACRQWEAATIVERHLEDVVKMLETRDAIVLKVSNDGVTTYPTQWR